MKSNREDHPFCIVEHFPHLGNGDKSASQGTGEWNRVSIPHCEPNAVQKNLCSQEAAVFLFLVPSTLEQSQTCADLHHPCPQTRLQWLQWLLQASIFQEGMDSQFCQVRVKLTCISQCWKKPCISHLGLNIYYPTVSVSAAEYGLNTLWSQAVDMSQNITEQQRQR